MPDAVCLLCVHVWLCAKYIRVVAACPTLRVFCACINDICLYYRTYRNNLVAVFRALEVQSIILTQVSD